MKQLFSQYGLKNTKPRSYVYNILKKTKKPLCAEDIYLKCQTYDQAINLSTVYRILDIFLEKELIIKPFINGESKACFMINKHQHKHFLICESCQKIVEVDYCPFKQFEKQIEKQTNFSITNHKFELHGRCPDCKEKT